MNAKLTTLIIVIALFAQSCGFEHYETPADNAAEFFDFATTEMKNVRINYDVKSDEGYKIKFSIYDQDPYIYHAMQDGTYVRTAIDKDIIPLITLYTDDNGQYDGKIVLPSSVERVFIQTNNFGVPQVVTATVNESEIAMDMRRTRGVKSGEVYQYNEVPEGWKTLGKWNELGRPEYLLEERSSVSRSLFLDIWNTLPEEGWLSRTDDKAHWVEADTKARIDVVEDGTELEMTFVHCGGTWTNAIGYYHYTTPEDGDYPNIEDVTKIIAFPNASYAADQFPSDMSPGAWFSTQREKGSLSTGNKIALKYWNGEEFEDSFPANTSIGFVILPNAFTNNKVNGAKEYYSDFAMDQSIKQQHVVLWDKEREMYVIAMEDNDRTIPYAQWDEDFNDVIFFVEATETATNPTGNPEIDPAEDEEYELTIDEYFGTLAFEDLWPSQGDYDMNDLVITYESKIYKNENNEIVKIEDVWVPKWSGATFRNSFGYQIGTTSNKIKGALVESDYNKEVSMFNINSKGLEEGQNLATIMLFDNMNDVMGIDEGSVGNGNHTFAVTTEFVDPIVQDNREMFPPYNSFIVANIDKTTKRYEVHLPEFNPTSLADKSIFGTHDDRSNPEMDKWYVSEADYPFAIVLPIMNYRVPEETKTIDTTYPLFKKWVETAGQEAKEWYK